MKTRIQQKDFFSKQSDYRPHRISHGGEASLGRRKLARPLDYKKPVHAVMKSSLAQGSLNFLTAKNKLEIDKIIRTSAEKFGVKIRQLQNMGNHLHFLLTFKTRAGVQNFLRAVPALIARFVTGARRGKPFGKRFWDHLTFTRVVTGRRDYTALTNYFYKNAVERDVSSFGRTAIELHEKAERIAKRRGCDGWQVLDEWNQKNATE